jgi:TonB family protein
MQLVRKVQGRICYIEHAGRLVPASRKAKTGLVDVREYLPFFVLVRDMKAELEMQEIGLAHGESTTLGRHFRFVMRVESEYRLENVYLLLDIKDAYARRHIFYHGIGTLEPRVSRLVVANVPHPILSAEGHYRLHLFSDGGELLHSGQPEEYREAQLVKIVMHRREGVRDAEALPLIGPEPEYPESLRSRGLRGEAVVRMKVNQSGAVLDPTISEATAPEFGAPALAAARQWRFLPRMKNGVPMETEVEMPFRFDPSHGPVRR